LAEVTSGAPIYLVSACASGEEFVAAFRRYADRNGVVFVPIADPLPSGKKARFALTLKDGGVMVEGDAEVVSSARTPSVLYGRVGMTLKFLVPDEPSKTTLTELEKARLALKPTPPTIAPRPAEVPAEPRPKPPVPSGRVDAVNALAECVAIGAGIPAPGEGGEVPPKNANQKFVVPPVPSLPPGRPRTPSTPGGQPVVRPGGTNPPPFKPPPTPTTLGIAPLAKPAPVPAPSPQKADLLQTMRGPAPGVDLTRSDKVDLSTTMRGTKPAMPPAARNPPPASTPPPIPRAATPATALPVAKPQRMTTPFAPMPIVQQPAPPVVAQARPAVPEVEVSEPTDLTAIPQVEDAVPDALSETTIPIEVPHEDGSAPVMIVAGKPEEDKPEKAVREPRRTVMGIAVVPSGVMVLPAAPALRTPSDDEVRDTGVMDVPNPVTVRGDAVDDVDALSPTLPPQMPLRPSVVQSLVVQPSVVQPSVVQPTVEEPTPSGDWTMTPGVDGPTITATQRDKPPAKVIPKGSPTGNWVIALDPSQPDGWSEPSKVAKPPPGELPPGPPVSAVSGDVPLDSNKRPGADQSFAPEPTVQVDPTLIGPLKQMPKLDGDDDQDIDPPLPPPPSVQRPVVGTDGLMPIPTSVAELPMPQGMNEAPPMAGPKAQQMHGPMPGSFVTPPAGPPQLASASGTNPVFPPHPAQSGFTPQRVVTDAGSGFFRDSGDIPSYASGASPALDDAARRKRNIVIIAAAAGVVVLGVILILALGGGGKDTATTEASGISDKTALPDTTDKHSVVVSPKLDAGSETPVAIDAATAVAPPVDAAVVAVTPTDCQISVTSAPSGADVLIAKAVVGTTPASLTLPCGVETKLVLRKARYATQNRVVTPKAVGQKPIRVALAKVTFSVKVSSTPPGASITVGTRSMGFTPTTVRLPAYELSTLKIAKPGFSAETQKITPKQNNQTVHATLKRQPKRGR
jgi:hypothetical protein